MADFDLMEGKITRTVLFVDDEPNILAGLRRMLRSMRRRRNFLFAGSGREALDLLATGSVDVVVSDMRMPGMDGAELLTAVKKRHPGCIRVMLTGHADNEAILRTVGVVHQFLSKPIDPDLLRQVLERALALQDHMENERLRALISGIDSLPCLPQTFARLQTLLQSPDCSMAEVGRVIESDLAMSAKILQLVNSAFFGLFRHVESPARAVNLLGLDTIKALVLAVGVFSELQTTRSAVFSVADLWSHSFGCAMFSREIARLEEQNKEMVDNCFIAGLMHDVGKLLLFSCLPAEFEQAVTLARENGMLLARAERAVFGADHGAVGGYLLGLWGLPGPVVEGVVFHQRLETYPEPSFSPALAVHAADIICHRLDQKPLVGIAPQAASEHLAEAGYGDRLEIWESHCVALANQREKDD